MLEALCCRQITLTLESVEAMLVLAKRLQVPLIASTCYNYLAQSLKAHWKVALPMCFRHPDDPDMVSEAITSEGFKMPGSERDWYLTFDVKAIRGKAGFTFTWEVMDWARKWDISEAITSEGLKMPGSDRNWQVRGRYLTFDVEAIRGKAGSTPFNCASRRTAWHRMGSRLQCGVGDAWETHCVQGNL
ncbi:hypothetical protein WJX72_002566 [[Myrmecia] bisecta]|uniref:Uncharacterized protein n=1 Tax=[Myrmecia] bisecta TaxID=41462 RepID=A0AAW1QPP3_9CHLO